MKARKAIAVFAASGMFFSIAGTAHAATFPQFADGWGGRTFDPLSYEDAVTFSEMREMLGTMKDVEVVEPMVTIRSRMHQTDIPQLEALVNALLEY